MVERARQIRARVLAACSLKDRHAVSAKSERHRTWASARRRIAVRLATSARNYHHDVIPTKYSTDGVFGDAKPLTREPQEGMHESDAIARAVSAGRNSAGRRAYWCAELGDEPSMADFFDWLAYNKAKW